MTSSRNHIRSAAQLYDDVIDVDVASTRRLLPTDDDLTFLSYMYHRTSNVRTRGKRNAHSFSCSHCLLNILVTHLNSPYFYRDNRHCSTRSIMIFPCHASSQDAAGQRARWRARRARQMYKNYSDTQISTRPWLGVGRHVCRCRSAALLLLLTYLLAWGWALTSRQHEIQQSRFRFLQITDLEAGSMAMMTGDDWR